MVQIDAGAFQGNESMASVTIPAKVKRIEDFAFNDCGSLVEVTLNEGVESLGLIPLETVESCR